MIKSVKEVRKEFEEYLDNLISEDPDEFLYYDYSGFDYSYIKEHLDEIEDNYIVFIDENGNINNFVYYKKEPEYDYFVIDVIENSATLKDNLNDIRKNYKKPIIAFSDNYFDSSLVGNLYEINLNSKVVIDEKYDYNEELYCLNEEDKDMIVDLADELNFPQYSGNITYEILDEEALSKLTNFDEVIPTTTKNSSNQYHFAGFTYFSPEYINNNHILIAKDGNNIVGVLKYGPYGEDELKHIAVCYIDVKKPYRNKGIATNLFKEFGRIMEEAHKKGKMDLPIFLTSESEMGEQCHMAKIALENIKNLVVYLEDRDKYEYVLYFNNEELDRNMDIRKLMETYNDKIVYKPPTLEDLIDQGLSLKEISSIINNNDIEIR